MDKTTVNGVAKWENLKPGTYTLTEETPPTGYKASTNSPWTITIKSDGTAEELDVKKDVVNTKILGSLTVNKQDQDGADLTGATFELKDSTGAVIAISENNDPEFIWKDLDPGTYTLTETAAPAGYSKGSGNPWTIVIKHDGTAAELDVVRNIKNTEILGSLTITKVDDQGVDMVALGATFKLWAGYPVTTGTPETASSSTYPEFKWENLPAGEYTLKEMTAPTGYKIKGDGIYKVIIGGPAPNVIDVQTSVVDVWDVEKDIENDKDHCSLTVTKVDNGDPANTIDKYAKFTLTGINGDGTYSKTIESSTGEFKWDDLEPGNYVLTEDISPDGYYWNQQTHNVTVSFDSAAEQDKEMDVVNYEYGSLKIIKKSVTDTVENMVGVSFTLTGPDNYSDTQVTDGNGEITWSDLKPGEYELTEAVPTGFFVTDGQGGVEITNVTPITIDAGEDEEQTIWNEKYISITVLKTSKLTGEPLEGAVFDISYESTPPLSPNAFVLNAMVSLGTKTSGPDGRATFAYPEFKLKAGIAYIITEITPPPGFANDSTPITVTVDTPGGSNEGEVGLFSNSPLPGSFSLHKYDIDFPEISLQGATFTLTGTTLINGFPEEYTWFLITDEFGNASIPVDNVPALMPGVYVLIETSAPTNYTIEQTIYSVTIVSEENTHQDVANRGIPGSAVVAKRNSATGQTLPGVAFALYEGTESPANMIGSVQYTNAQGNVFWSNLRPGTYVMVEIGTVPGYLTPTYQQARQTFTVYAGQRAEIAFYNTPITTRTPTPTPTDTPVPTPTPTPTPIPEEEFIIEDEAIPFGAETGENDTLYIVMGLLLLLALALLLIRRKLVLKK